MGAALCPQGANGAAGRFGLIEEGHVTLVVELTGSIQTKTCAVYRERVTTYLERDRELGVRETYVSELEALTAREGLHGFGMEGVKGARRQAPCWSNVRR